MKIKKRPMIDKEHLDALDTLQKRALAGDSDSLEHIRGFLDRHPELWKHMGEVSRLVERGWLEQVSGGNLIAFEAMLRQTEVQKAELLGDSPSATERLLVDDIVATRLELQAGQLMLNGNAGGIPISAHRLKRINSSHQRFQSTIKLLEEFRGKLSKAEQSIAPSSPPAKTSRNPLTLQSSARPKSKAKLTVTEPVSDSVPIPKPICAGRKVPDAPPTRAKKKSVDDSPLRIYDPKRRTA